VTGGFGATTFGCSGRAGGLRTRVFRTTTATRRVGVTARRAAGSDRVEIGATTALAALDGASAAPASVATNTSAAASATTKPTTASGLPNHIQWSSTPVGPG
jgi:hypothetical protein